MPSLQFTHIQRIDTFTYSLYISAKLSHFSFICVFHTYSCVFPLHSAQLFPVNLLRRELFLHPQHSLGSTLLTECVVLADASFHTFNHFFPLFSFHFYCHFVVIVGKTYLLYAIEFYFHTAQHLVWYNVCVNDRMCGALLRTHT